MGMAASQARFLMLTARKSNVEYEGQQVNQQRTALANESANLYNQLSSIKVPTPPSTSDYYETVYKFSTSELDTSSGTTTQYTLNNIYSTPDGTYANLSFTAYKWESALTTAYKGDVNFKPSTDPTKPGKYSVSLSNGVVADAIEYNYQPAQAEIKIQLDERDNPTTGEKEKFINIDGTNYVLKGKTLTDETEAGTFEVIDNGDGTYTVRRPIEKQADDTFIYKINGVPYEVSDPDGDGVYECVVPPCIPAELGKDVLGKYVSSDGNANSAVSYLDKSFTDYNNKHNQAVLAYTLNNTVYFISSSEFKSGSFNSSSYVQQVGYPVKVDYPCTYTTAASGRYQTLTVTDDYGRTHQFDLNVTTVQDEAKYAQAMLDYEYEQAKYQKKVQDINSKTEALQQEDRTLELRLKQLDTEQNAIKTEMDAVKKVIEDNVEATFKTFA